MIAALPAKERDQRRRRGLWEYVSPSRLALWLKCPLAFRLRYIDGITAPTSPAAFVGKMVHSLLEQFYRHRQLGITLSADELGAPLARQWGQAAVDEHTLMTANYPQPPLRPWVTYASGGKTQLP